MGKNITWRVAGEGREDATGRGGGAQNSGFGDLTASDTASFKLVDGRRGFSPTLSLSLSNMSAGTR